jgi:hypothetical protein
MDLITRHGLSAAEASALLTNRPAFAIAFSVPPKVGRQKDGLQRSTCEPVR